MHIKKTYFWKKTFMLRSEIMRSFKGQNCKSLKKILVFVFCHLTIGIHIVPLRYFQRSVGAPP